MNTAQELLNNLGKEITARQFKTLVEKLPETEGGKKARNLLRKAANSHEMNVATHVKIEWARKGEMVEQLRIMALADQPTHKMSLGDISNLGIEILGADLGATKNTFFAEVTRRILELIKKGTLPWQMPWNKQFKDSAEGIMFANYITNKNYRGINRDMCSFFGAGDRYFLTKAQAEERGGKIKDERKSIPIGYFVRSFKNYTVERENEKGEKEMVEVKEVIQGMKWYRVYGLSNIEGLKPIKRKVIKKPKGLDFKPIEIAEKIVQSYPGRPPVEHRGNEAYYTPGNDKVVMPPKASFNGVSEYYSTLFHELIHSTGHPARLDRLKPAKFGSKIYAQEELVAELGSSFLCTICSIDYFTLNNSAAYLKNWSSKLIEEMSKDKQFFLRTQFAAHKAAKYMMGGFYKQWERSLEMVESKPKPKAPKSAKPAEPAPRKPKAIKVKSKKSVALKFQPVTDKDYLAEFLQGKRIKTQSWDRFADKNLRDRGIALNWLSKDGYGLDQLAKFYRMDRGLEGKYDENEIIESIIDFVQENPGGPVSYMRRRIKDEEENPLENENYNSKEWGFNGSKRKGLSGLNEVPRRFVSAKELAEVKIETMDLPEIWKKWIGSPAPNFDMVVYGGPGARKTTLLLMLADDLAKMGKRVAFASSEEFGSPTLAQKVKYLEVEDVDFAGHYKDFNLPEYDVLFIDSINDMRITLDEYKILRQDYPNLAVIFILQSTKSGNFRGGQDWIHEAEIQVEVQNGKTITHKNRWNSQVTEIDLNS